MEFNNVHLIGVSGIGMSALACWLANENLNVSGCDLKEPYFSLEEENVIFMKGHSIEHLRNIDTVIYSSAIKPNHKELLAAKNFGLNILHRANALALLANKTDLIAVTGTHGKTTISAMIAWILYKAREKVVAAIGGVNPIWGKNFIFLGNKWGVIEADESDKSLNFYKPKIAVITKIELDHPDNFKDVDEIKKTVKVFSSKAELVITDSDCFTNSNNDLVLGKDFGFKYRKIIIGSEEYDLQLNEGLDFEFNYYNASFAVAAVKNIVSPDKAVEYLKDFPGTKRRTEFIGTFKGIKIFDDYAHHPTQVKKIIEQFKKKYGKVAFVFEPHRYSRLNKLFDEFVEALKEAEFLALMPVYSAGETDKLSTSDDLAKAINSSTKILINLKQVREWVENLSKIEAIVFLGAGNVSKLGHNLAKSV